MGFPKDLGFYQFMPIFLALSQVVGRIICLRHCGQSSKEFRHDKSSIHNHHQEKCRQCCTKLLQKHLDRVASIHVILRQTEQTQ